MKNLTNAELVQILESFGFEKKSGENDNKFYYQKGKVSIRFDYQDIRYNILDSENYEHFDEQASQLACIILLSELKTRSSEFKLFKQIISNEKLGSNTITYLRQFRGLDDPTIYGDDCNTKSKMYLEIIAILFNIDSDAGILECEKAFKR